MQVIRRHKLFFAAFTLVGILLRESMLKWHFLFEGDSLVYGDLAKNWLLHGTYGLTAAGSVMPVDIRMPGYPAFLASCFRLFGPEHYGAVVHVQLVIDLLTCFIITAAVARLYSDTAAKWTFALAALCPFTANYTATPLPETLAIFSAAVALAFAMRAVQRMSAAPPSDVQHSYAIGDWTISGLAIAASIYLRPDGGVLLLGIGIYLVWMAMKSVRGDYLLAAAILTCVSLLPLLPWTVRNWKTLHRFEPLAPFYAQLPEEYVPKGFNRWSRTWVVDFISVMNVEWNVATEGGGETIDVKDVPDRAFDDSGQREETQRLFAEYNQTLTLSPQMDEQFAQLAAERVRTHPIRYYVLLPLARVADMWLRPRTEMLNLQLDWWTFDPWQESLTSLGLAAVNLFYVVAALFAVRRKVPGAGILWLFIICRSILLATLVNPEPRYTLECFPALMMLAGVAMGGPRGKTRSQFPMEWATAQRITK
jgi:hypothetical protein